MPAPSPRVTVVIPNWNGVGHLPECLEALAAQSMSEFEVLLVDNASSDGSVAWVREHHPEVRILQRPDNGGFSKAVNAGIVSSRSEYVALLNNDTAVDAGWLGALVGSLDEHRAYDFAASRMILFDEPDRLNAAGDVYLLGLMAGKNRGFGEPLSRYATMERVLGACAGAALYRRSLFRDVGLFDEDFFLMSEDTDFNLRCLIAGKRCLYVPAARVRHKLRASIETETVWAMTRLAARNEAIVAAKDLPAEVLLLTPILWPYRFVRQTLLVRPSRWHLVPMLLRHSPARFRAEVEGARLGLAKRPDVWRRRSVGTLEIIRWLLRGHGPAMPSGQVDTTPAARLQCRPRVAVDAAGVRALATQSTDIGGDVEVIIVAHNSGHLLAETVATAAEQAGADGVWVVDAASSDGSVAAARRRTPGFHVISATNDGFATANNRGLAATHAPFVLLLNPDAILLPGALDVLVSTARAQPRAAIVGPLVLDLDGCVQAGSLGRFPTLAGVLTQHLRRAGGCRGGRAGRCQPAPSVLASVDWVTGAAMLVRRDAISEVGAMDEGFFLYYEDVEWCHRMREGGWDVLVEPAAKVAHHRGTAAAPSTVAESAYRASFYRYCDLYGLWGLKGMARVVLPLRRRVGGRA